MNPLTIAFAAAAVLWATIALGTLRTFAEATRSGHSSELSLERGRVLGLAIVQGLLAFALANASLSGGEGLGAVIGSFAAAVIVGQYVRDARARIIDTLDGDARATGQPAAPDLAVQGRA